MMLRSWLAAFASVGSLASIAVAGSGGQSSPGPWVDPNGRPQVNRHILVRVAPNVELLEGESAFGYQMTGVSEIDALNQRYAINAVYRVHAEPTQGRRNPAAFRGLGLDRIYYFQFPAGRGDLAKVTAEYEALVSIDSSWVDQLVQHCGTTPNDPQWSNQWNLTAEDLDCPAAWDFETDATEVISVLDSGADLKHADLDGNLWVNSGEIPGNKKDDDGNGYVDDVNGWDFWNGDADPTDDSGHGTHVAGIVGAEGNNKKDIAGICWKAKVQIVKVLSAAAEGTWTSISQGMVYAADNGCRVANYSLGGTSWDSGVESAVQYAAAVDIVQVAAAGNNASDTAFYPAAMQPCIAVMGSDWSEKRARWTNYGDWCHLCAPGDGITSLMKGGGVTIYTGTSQSAPHVSAIAAMVRSVNTQLDRIDTQLLILHTAKDLGTPGVDPTYQWGIADLNQAVRAAASLKTSTQSAKIGDRIDLTIERGDFPDDIYVLVPSVSGREPGYDLGGFFPNEERWMPLNYDIVSDLSVIYPNIGVFVNFIGALDSNGKAQATLNVPKGRLFDDTLLTFSGVILSASDLSIVKSVLPSVNVVLQ